MERELGGTTMTVLGKILVILNLVFAIVVGGLLVVVYSRHTNWEAAYKVKKEEFEAAQISRKQYEEDAKQARDAQKTFEADQRKLVDAERTRNDELARKNDDL